jgi:hypothetical protein
VDVIMSGPKLTSSRVKQSSKTDHIKICCVINDAQPKMNIVIHSDIKKVWYVKLY